MVQPALAPTPSGPEFIPGVCAADPKTFATAEPIDDFGHVDQWSCGIRNGYIIQAIGDVTFSQPAKMNCGMANVLNDWIDGVVQPAAKAIYGVGVVSMRVPDSYSCRSRNSVRGAKLSEHGHGNAIDFSAFILANGREVNIDRDYDGKGDDRRFLRTIRAKGCGMFHTVLGPGVAYHDDHLHYDLQPLRRGGSAYCP